MPIKPVTNSQPNMPRNEKVYEAAKMYEQQFLREMVRAMRSTVAGSELVPKSMGEKIFSEQLDNEYVEGWSQRGGVGFADLIYNHIMEKYFNSNVPLQRPKGPIPIDQSTGKVKVEGNSLQINLKSKDMTQPQAVISPWGGQIQQVSKDGTQYGIIRHDNGLESKICYLGLALKSEGRVEAGEKIGVKNAGPEEINWYVKTRT